MKYDGKATWQGFNVWSSSVVAASIEGNTLRYVLNADDLKIESVNLESSTLVKNQELAPFRLEPERNFRRDGIIKNRTVILFPGDPYQLDATRTAAFYRIDDGSALVEFNRYVGPFNHVAKTARSLAFFDPKLGRDSFSVDIETGNVLDATNLAELDRSSGVVTTGDFVYQSTPDNFQVSVSHQSEVKGAKTNLGLRGPIFVPGVSGPWLAGIGVDTFFIPKIELHDSTGESEPKVLEIPGEMYLWFRLTAEVLEWFGLSPLGRRADLDALEIHLTLGRRYLCLWISQGGINLSRVALWDISDHNRVKFIGIFPGFGTSWIEQYTLGPWSKGIQPPMEPIERDDGALGFETQDNAILWLEIPSLMKEPRT